MTEAEGVATTTEVFVASPIGSPNTPGHTHAKKVLKYIVKKALPEPDWHVTRADDDQAPDSITQKVVGRIIRADLVVVDITDHNPNVFYELAIAHCFKRPVVIIATQGTSSPFDVVDQTRIDYDLTDPESVYAAQERLLAAAQLALANPDKLVTPLTTFEAVSLSAERLETGDQGEFANILSAFTSRLSHIEALLERRVSTPPRPGPDNDADTSRVLWEEYRHLLLRAMARPTLDDRFAALSSATARVKRAMTRADEIPPDSLVEVLIRAQRERDDVGARLAEADVALDRDV